MFEMGFHLGCVPLHWPLGKHILTGDPPWSSNPELQCIPQAELNRLEQTPLNRPFSGGDKWEQARSWHLLDALDTPLIKCFLSPFVSILITYFPKCKMYPSLHWHWDDAQLPKGLVWSGLGHWMQDLLSPGSSVGLYVPKGHATTT